LNAQPKAIILKLFLELRVFQKNIEFKNFLFTLSEHLNQGEYIMKRQRENLELISVIFALVILILFFLSLFVQVPVIINAVRYDKEISEITALTEKEIDEICLGEPCNYTHKVIFDNHAIKVSNPGTQFSNQVWVYYETIRSKKVYVDRSYFLFTYLVFDFVSIAYLFVFYRYMKGLKKKEKEPTAKTAVQDKVSESEEPLPPFGGIFVLGYLHFLLCFLLSYAFAKYLPGQGLAFFLSFLSPFVIGIIFYFVTRKNLAFILTSILCLAPAISGKDILYLDILLNPKAEDQTEKIFTLDAGSLDRSHIGAYVTTVASGKQSRNRSYYYHFVAPYQMESNSFVHWLVLKQEWMEDETKFELFWDEWKDQRLAVQIDDEQTMYAITKAGERYGLDLSQGVALMKPITSINAELQTTIGKVFWTDGIALAVWTCLGMVRIYAGRK